MIRRKKPKTHDSSLREEVPINPMPSAIESLRQQLSANTTRSLNKMAELLREIELIPELPKGFIDVKDKVQIQLGVLNKDESRAEKRVNPTLRELPIPYSKRPEDLKYELEQRWNSVLTELCWELHTAFKIKQPSTDTEAIDGVYNTVNSVIDNLSTCYFKNLDLAGNMPTRLKRVLNTIAQPCLAHGFTLIIKGSYFAAPGEAHDLDLLLVPLESTSTQGCKGTQLIEMQHKINILMGELEKKITRSARIKTFFNPSVYQHTLTIHGGIQVDFNFLFTPFTPQLAGELQKTAEARLSFTAVHLHADGHAVMLPQTARAICTDRPVLTFLGPVADKSETGYITFFNQLPPDTLGYFAKNIMKFYQDKQDNVRLDPFFTRFKHHYLNSQNPHRPEQGVSAILSYLLAKELGKRPKQTVLFILEHELINAVYPLDRVEFPYKRCEDNFKAYLSFEENYECIKSPYVLLSLLFLCAMMNTSPPEKTKLLEDLRKIGTFCGFQTPIIADVLQALPSDREEFNALSVMYKAQCLTVSSLGKGCTDILTTLFSLSQPQALALAPGEILLEPIPSVTARGYPYLRDRFFAARGESGLTTKVAPTTYLNDQRLLVFGYPPI